MEPLDACSIQETPFIDIHVIIGNTFLLVLLNIGKSKKSLRLRGSGEDMNNDDKFNKIPYLDNIRFKWNGLPCMDFREKVLFLLENGLGSMMSNGGTLLQTVRQRDPGGVLGNPARAVAPQRVVDESIARGRKAFSCIMNYIVPKCYLYKYFNRHMPGEAIPVYQIICAYGPVPIPPRIAVAREDAWHRMSMEALRIKNDYQGLLLWAEMVTEHGRILQKDGAAIKDRFIDGLPSKFDSIKHSMSRNMAFVYPATYGALPGHAGCAIAAIAHPLAGQQYTFALARAYVSEWVTRAADLGTTPRGYTARSVEEMDALLTTDIDDIALILAEHVTPQMVCEYCGGVGHCTRQKKANGETLTCVSKLLGHNKNTESFDKLGKYKKQVTSMAHEIEDLTTELDAFKLRESDSRKLRRKPPRTQGSTSKHALSSEAEATTDNESGHSVTDMHALACDSDDDEGSDDSAHSAVVSFADAHMASKDSRKLRKSPRGK